MTGVMFLRPPSLVMRAMAVVVGLVWAAGGGWWSYEVAVNGLEFPTRRSSNVCYAVLAAGVMLVISGLRRAKSQDFEDEIPDLGGRLRRRTDDDFGD
jgi:hypothetical protein